MSADLLKDVRACVNRHRGRDYAETISERTRRERYEKLKAIRNNTLTAIAVAAAFFAAIDIVETVADYPRVQAEVTELRTKVADLQSWDCRAGVGTQTREIKFCSRPRAER